MDTGEAGPSNPAAPGDKYFSTPTTSTENPHSSENKKQISYFIETSFFKKNYLKVE